MTLSTDYERVLLDAYLTIIEEYDLPTCDVLADFLEAYPSEKFCWEVYCYYSVQFADGTISEILHNYCVAAYYGCIYASVMWGTGRREALGKSGWDGICENIDIKNIEDISDETEALLNIYVNYERGIEEEDEEKIQVAEEIYGIILEFIDSVQLVVSASQCGVEDCMFMMKFAYFLGLYVAERELWYLD